MLADICYRWSCVVIQQNHFIVSVIKLESFLCQWKTSVSNIIILLRASLFSIRSISNSSGVVSFSCNVTVKVRKKWENRERYGGDSHSLVGVCRIRKCYIFIDRALSINTIAKVNSGALQICTREHWLVDRDSNLLITTERTKRAGSWEK